jgi:hypothetical protein
LKGSPTPAMSERGICWVESESGNTKHVLNDPNRPK